MDFTTSRPEAPLKRLMTGKMSPIKVTLGAYMAKTVGSTGSVLMPTDLVAGQQLACINSTDCLRDVAGDCICFGDDVLAWRALSRATGGEPRGGVRGPPAAPPGSHRQALTLDDPLGPERRAWVQADTVKSQCPDGALTMSMISAPSGHTISSSLPSGTIINLPNLVPK